MKTILVTGGSGFIGANLCRRLLDEGNKVICLDFFLSSSADNIRPLLDHPNFTFIYRDIEYCNDLYFSNIDQIYHLACPELPIHYQLDAVKTLRTSVLGSINMLELARKTNATILQASTSEIYGAPIQQPQSEDHCKDVSPIGLHSCYEEGKRCAESLMYNYHLQYGIKVKIVRIFDTYGPYMPANEGNILSNFIVQAIKDEPVTIYGNESLTKSFLYIDDLVEGMIRMMNNTPDDYYGPVNLGNPEEFTVSEIAEKVINLSGSKSKIVKSSLPADSITIRCPDITRATKDLAGWRPSTSLEQGLENTIEYFKNLIEPIRGHQGDII